VLGGGHFNDEWLMVNGEWLMVSMFEFFEEKLKHRMVNRLNDSSLIINYYSLLQNSLFRA
jgi:hypothetical protein